MALLDATSIPRLMRLVESGMLDVSSLVTHCKLNPCWSLHEIINLLDTRDSIPILTAQTKRSPWQRRIRHTARSRQRLNIGP